MKEQANEDKYKFLNGYILSEVASVPILTWDTANTKGVGKPLDEFEMDIRDLGIEATWKGNNNRSGELWIKAIKGSKFLGYEAPYEGVEEWIETGDVVTMDEDGVIDIITNKEDLIVDNSGQLIEHWLLEKALCAHNDVKGAQIVALGKKLPLYAFIVLKNSHQANLDIILTDLTALCKNNKLNVPTKFAIVDDFPRINTKIQKYRMREMLENGEVQLKP